MTDGRPVAIDIPEKDELITQDDFEDMEPPANSNAFAQATFKVRSKLAAFFERWVKIISIVIGIIFTALYFAYFGYAMYVEQLKNESSIRLLWVTCCVVFFVAIYFLRRFFGHSIGRFCGSITRPLCDAWKNLNDRFNGIPKLVVGIIFIVIMVLFKIIILVVFAARSDTYNLMSLLGIFLLILSGYLGSAHPDKIRWRPILVGLSMQFIFALLIIKTVPGFEVFKFMGDRVAEFLGHTSAGATFIFDTPQQHLAGFAFVVLPIIIFFSTFISVLYHIGLMQFVIAKVAWFMQVLMGTTAGESLNAAGNIFVGMIEAPLMIRPFIGKMTNSELHAVMTGGFATIAGSVLGAYIKFGVSATHLISASVMSAPAALAISKLFYPETKKSKTIAYEATKMEKSPYGNLVEAATAGAVASVQLVANIAVTLVAFLAILQFVNETLTWFGNRAGMTTPLTFQFICSYLLWPLAFVMGVSSQDCGRVAELIGIKTFLNEYIAYSQLGKLIENGKSFHKLTTGMTPTPEIIRNGTDFFVPTINKTFVGGFLVAERSEVIATYSLCGFANFGSIGITIGALSVLAPHRRKDIASIVVRAMVAGNVACFLTGCIAGLFYESKK